MPSCVLSAGALRAEQDWHRDRLHQGNCGIDHRFFALYKTACKVWRELVIRCPKLLSEA